MSRETIRGIVIASIGAPLLFVDTSWARALLHSYALTTLLFGLLLVPEYQCITSRFPLKPILFLIVIHAVIVAGVIVFDLKLAPVLGAAAPARMVFGILGLILVLEWRLAVYLITRFEPNRE